MVKGALDGSFNSMCFPEAELGTPCYFRYTVGVLVPFQTQADSAPLLWFQYFPGWVFYP